MNPFYIYQLREDGTARSYDEAIAAACMQGLANRDSANIYLVCEDDEKHRTGAPGYDRFGSRITRPRATPWFWLDKMREEGRWLNGREYKKLCSIDELFEITKEHINGAVIWDTEVPSTVNVATTVAGVEGLIVMSEEFFEDFGKRHGLEIKCDLRGKFDGRITGSAKVDAYNWAIENYLEKELCSNRLIANLNDAWHTRQFGWTTYCLERDRIIAEKAFCFELSPWEYFNPKDEPDEPLGLEKATMLKIFETVCKNSKGNNMTEFFGFFNIEKLEDGQKNGVLTEWEQVHLMSPYNVYQNTVVNDVYNQSFHKWAPRGPLKQGRPFEEKELENKVYLCIQICDMDSATPLYDTMIQLWHDERRGELPLAWGINPNLAETYPDLFEYFYSTRSDNDYFCADAGAAGYFNASRIPDEHWDTVIKHCKYWYDETDMTISGMVLDGDHPTKKVLSSYAKFSPDGFCSLVSGYHGGRNIRPSRQIFDGMPVSHMTIAGCDWLGSSKKMAELLTECYVGRMSANRPEFLYYRICYRDPGEMFDVYYELKKLNPHLTIEAVDPYTYFDLIAKYCKSRHGLDPCIGASAL